jgi:hypothetical protein
VTKLVAIVLIIGIITVLFIDQEDFRRQNCGNAALAPAGSVC